MARMKFVCDAERCIECNGCTLTSKGGDAPLHIPRVGSIRSARWPE